MSFEKPHLGAASAEREIDLAEVGPEAAVAEALDFMRHDPGFKDRDEVQELISWLEGSSAYAEKFRSVILDKIEGLQHDLQELGSALKLRPSEIVKLALETAQEMEFDRELTQTLVDKAPVVTPGLDLPAGPLELEDYGASHDSNDQPLTPSAHSGRASGDEQVWANQALQSLMSEVQQLRPETGSRVDPEKSEYFLGTLEAAKKNFALKPIIQYLESGTPEAQRDRRRLAQRINQEIAFYVGHKDGRLPRKEAIARALPLIFDQMSIAVPKAEKGSVPVAAEDRQLSVTEQWLAGAYEESVRAAFDKLASANPVSGKDAPPELRRRAETSKRLGIIGRQLPDLKEAIIGEVCESLMGLLDRKLPAQLDPKAYAHEVESSLAIVVDRLWAARDIPALIHKKLSE